MSKGLQSDQGLAFLTKLDVLHHEIEDMEVSVYAKYRNVKLE